MDDESKKYIKKHLKYELEMLLMATAATQMFDKNHMGSLCSTTRDSIYVHTRNLHNFFCTNSKNDRHIDEFGHPSMPSPISKDEIKALNSHVLHIKKQRRNSTNRVDLSQVACGFAEKMIKLWKRWITDTKDDDVKNLLVSILAEAKQSENNTKQNLENIFCNNTPCKKSSNPA